MNLREFSSPALRQALQPNIWDIVALILVTGAMVLIVYGGEQTTAPLSTLDVTPVTLDPSNLPLYALRTTMRMLLAIVCSIIFTFIYAALAAKSRRAEMVLIPLLDILQSVPILGFLTFTVVFFMNLFPGSVFGAELACVFAIFTSQAWNMTFSMYQSMRNVPKDLEEASQSFHLSGWQRFWRLDVPFAMPGLIWNTMMSMSGGWFFVVASEAITVGNTTVTLPGIGSYVALGDPAAQSACDRLCDPDHAAGDHRLRPVAVSPRGGLGRQIPLRADRLSQRADLLDARPVPPHPRAAGAVDAVLGAEQDHLESAYRACRSLEAGGEANQGRRRASSTGSGLR